MNISNKQAILCYIDSNKILFYQKETGQILQLEFPPEVLFNLDLLSKAKFEQIIDTFLEQNKLTDSNALLVYASNSVFEKDFDEAQAGKEDSEIQKFIDIVPFEDVLSKTYKLNKKIKVVAVNNRVYESISIVLKKRNFLILGVIPVSVLQVTFSELTGNIDLGFILSRADSIKQYSMISAAGSTNPTLEKKPESKKQNKRLYALAGVFGVLLLVLIVLVTINILPKSTPPNSPGTVAPVLSPNPTILETSRNDNRPSTQESIATPSGSVSQTQ